ncbi:cysteine-rich RLK (receptor-like kinase) protein, putative [Medicago truncatula]|uniref:Cysteine-rich RLK (Receptor-like kinase) protein, putative n=1 Tax=Medicago truncatula TaxID=3880 RepID=G7JHD1_MEDTR|nr:cysteine-rich RLK (receptor-like kinase) protein, putative [Medicago truncatula]
MISESPLRSVGSPRKYALDILEETSLKDCKPVVDTDTNPNVKYRRLLEKLNYLTLTRPNISFSVSIVSQFHNSPRVNHWNSTSGYCIIVGGNLILWKSKM